MKTKEKGSNYDRYKEVIKLFISICLKRVESYTQWNGPQVHHAQSIGETAVGRRFGGRNNWRFIAKENEFESVVMKRLK